MVAASKPGSISELRVVVNLIRASLTSVFEPTATFEPRAEPEAIVDCAEAFGFPAAVESIVVFEPVTRAVVELREIPLALVESTAASERTFAFGSKATVKLAEALE